MVQEAAVEKRAHASFDSHRIQNFHLWTPEAFTKVNVTVR